VSVCVLLENVSHVQSDCTEFHADRGEVLSHMTAAPAALVLPQYEPVCASASAPENARTCGSSKLVSANATVHGWRQLFRQLEGRLPYRSTPLTENAVTLLSRENVQLTQ
jgi:hypothetical protein